MTVTTIQTVALLMTPTVVYMFLRLYVDSVKRRNERERAEYLAQQCAEDESDLVEEGRFSDTGKVP